MTCSLKFAQFAQFFANFSGKSALLKSFFTQRKVIEGQNFIYDQGKLALIGCNLVQSQDLKRQLRLCGFDFQARTLILTECSTTYMENEDVNRLLGLLRAEIDSFAFISYEQIRPFDTFGQIMVEHFKQRNSALKCVTHFPTIKDHKERFLQHLDQVCVKSVEAIWKNFVTDSQIEVLNQCEVFDEVPELMLKCLHYVLIIGLKNCPLRLDKFWTMPDKVPSKCVTIDLIKLAASPKFQR